MVTRAFASGKVILFGEHAVVYGRPAIAVPVSGVRAEAVVEDASPGQGITIEALDLGRRFSLDEAPADDPLRRIVEVTLRHLKVTHLPDLTITLRSTIPIARGLGSGAAVSTAIVRALMRHFGAEPEPQVVSSLVFEVEKIYHGTPSGIDNTVIAFEKPVFFVKGQPIQVIGVGRPFTLLIADTGIPSPTREVVLDVRRAWEEDPVRYERLFDEVGRVATEGRRAIERGSVKEMGRLMNRNHRLLVEMGVSCPELDLLVEAARRAGALGAKLSGAGRGGNMVALVEDETADVVERALREAGATSVLSTRVS